MTESDVSPAAANAAVVADEFALARRGVTAMLESLGIDVRAETHSAREVVALAMSEAADIVVIGALADGDAVEIVSRCKQLAATPTVVVLLAPRDQSNVAAYLVAGADGVFSRRASVNELSTWIGRVLNGDRTIGQQLTKDSARELAGELSGELAGDLSGSDTAQLSAREREMLVFLAQGATNREIAAALSLSLATVKSHLVHLYAKLGVSNRNEALGAAVARGLLA